MIVSILSRKTAVRDGEEWSRRARGLLDRLRPQALTPSGPSRAGRALLAPLPEGEGTGVRVV